MRADDLADACVFPMLHYDEPGFYEYPAQVVNIKSGNSEPGEKYRGYEGEIVNDLSNLMVHHANDSILQSCRALDGIIVFRWKKVSGKWYGIFNRNQVGNFMIY